MLPTRLIENACDVEPEALGCAPPCWIDGRRPADEQLAAFARTFTMRPGAWEILAPHLGFDARQYRRVRLYRGPEWEALLLCWLPGQATSVHDHGGSVGVSVVLTGTIAEVRYVRRADSVPLAVAGRGECGPGAAAVELPDTIHEMRNESPHPAVSLHMYSPPLTVLGAHDPALGTRWEVPVADSPDVQVGGNPKLIK
jgi:hypothetical protein